MKKRDINCPSCPQSIVLISCKVLIYSLALTSEIKVSFRVDIFMRLVLMLKFYTCWMYYFLFNIFIINNDAFVVYGNYKIVISFHLILSTKSWNTRNVMWKFDKGSYFFLNYLFWSYILSHCISNSSKFYIFKLQLIPKIK